MIDNRIFTFLELCDVMNYHKTAENLSMTQPAVTQHIKYLENLYKCKLFEYSNKQLSKTQKCLELEKYARSVISLNMSAISTLSQSDKIQLNVGATKTIGEYILDDLLANLLSNEQYQINITIDNTERLLERLNHFDLDILMLEGYVDKEKYQCQCISCDEIIGICSKSHPFAGKSIKISEILAEKVILREQGSGSRAVLEAFLVENGYTTNSFKNKSIISSNKLIEKSVEQNLAISFVYSIIPQKNPHLATFNIENSTLLHEFNYVFLSETKAFEFIKLNSPLYRE